jgi:hypothetical protein
MNITLTPEIERALVDEARRLGTTPESLAIESLRDRFLPSFSEELAEVPGETLADRLGDLIGSLHSGEFVPGGARLSEDIGGKFAAELLKRHRQGRSRS